ncbi:predicted protein [Naegleria gruberi]|uniref:Predicted protein n=1 Tax=Naegleria gruberi TaxID=5762 RepID=D2V694_NAEGR|nr:uncharacterized protein NAEGRDRAFT_64354 [Naegleria gruberi]EFC47921.1 predicted protein [Naegleria gruberi]|eukprot:XP_002680665.1 predicted protein [Naegleria gruberi strain NEG-M]
MNKLEALLSHDQNTSSTIASFESSSDPHLSVKEYAPTRSTSLLLPPSPSSLSNSSTCGDENQQTTTSPRGRTLSAMSMDQMREKVSSLSMRRRRLQKVQSASALVYAPPTSISAASATNTSATTTIPIPTLSILPTINDPSTPSTSISISPPISPQNSPERNNNNTETISIQSPLINISTPSTPTTTSSPLFAGISPLSSTSKISSFLATVQDSQQLIPSPTSQLEANTQQWDDSKYTMVVGGIVYVRMDYVKRQVEDIMHKYANTRREFKERERMMKKHYEKMDQEKTEKIELCMKEFEEKCASVQIKCRDAFLKKYNEKVDELNEKIKELMDEKEDLKNRMERESTKMYSDMQNLVSNVESKMKQNTVEFRVKQEELNKTIRIQKKLFFGLLNFIRSREVSRKNIDIQTEELVQDLELEQYRKQVEELKNILDLEQFEFQKVYVEKETRLINELTQSKHQLLQLESCMKEQTNAIKELENQISELNVSDSNLDSKELKSTMEDSSTPPIMQV